MGSARCCWQSESMHFLKRFGQGELGLNRIEGFSDGVFAIIVILLVLELKVPILHDRSSTSELGNRLVDLGPKFLSWLISFIIVCKFWLNNHHLLSFTRHATYGMIWLNSVFLMGQAFIPFPTALMGEYPMNPLAVSLFGAVSGAEHAALHRPAVVHPAKPDQAGDDQRTGAAPYAKIIGSS